MVSLGLAYSGLVAFGVLHPFNGAVISEIETLQKKLPNGGGYFMGIKADPMECPVGLPLEFCGNALLSPTRSSSYCSGVTYALLISVLEKQVQENRWILTQSQVEALRLQEPDGGRREDEVKLWGWWNADGPGSFYALTFVTQMGIRVAPKEALPGDFLNIDWAKGGGHSAIFLDWTQTADGKPGMKFWGSQASTNGIGEVIVPQDAIAGLVITRLTNPAGILSLNPNFQAKRPRVEYDKPPFVAR